MLIKSNKKIALLLKEDLLTPNLFFYQLCNCVIIFSEFDFVGRSSSSSKLELYVSIRHKQLVFTRSLWNWFWIDRSIWVVSRIFPSDFLWKTLFSLIIKTWSKISRWRVSVHCIGNTIDLTTTNLWSKLQLTFPANNLKQSNSNRMNLIQSLHWKKWKTHNNESKAGPSSQHMKKLIDQTNLKTKFPCFVKF